MSKVLMGFVGDVLVGHPTPLELFSEVREVLKGHQIMFANLEGPHTDDPRVPPHLLVGVSAPTRTLDIYAQAGFNVMSLANNHILDAGYDAMLETRSRLQAQGVKTCGAGDCSADAREPAIVETGGLRVAFLAYASFFPVGCEARSDRPGLAPMRAYNLYLNPFPNNHVPGVLPIVVTAPDQTDLAHLTEDIQRARKRADLVVTSFHWGDHTRPLYITDHEIRTAKHCIDQGAHMVVGHHHGIRGMEWYKGRPIMYGLGGFRFNVFPEGLVEKYKLLFEESDAGHYFYKQFPTYSRTYERRVSSMGGTTMIAWATAGRDGVSDIGFLPCKITSDRIHPLRLNTPESDQVLNLLEECNQTQGLTSRIVSEGSVSIAGFKTLRVVPN